MKKIRTCTSLLLILVLVICTTSCISNENDGGSVGNSKDVSVRYDINDMPTDSYLYNKVKYVYKYMNKYNIETPYFSEKKKVAEMLTVSNRESEKYAQVYVTCYETLGGKLEYSRTLEETEYLYWGEISKDNKPDGIGIIFRNKEYYDLESNEFPVYIGEFKDGVYHGYGVEMKYPETTMSHTMDVIASWTSYDEETLQRFGEPIYEGYFEEGKKRGQAIDMNSDIGTMNMETGETVINPEDVQYIIEIGEWKYDQIEGEKKVYTFGILEFEGNYDGYGKEYFLDSPGTVKYEGEFSNAEYEGEGTLYDIDGNIIYKGEFKNGDAA